jgi:hypothetical protein
MHYYGTFFNADTVGQIKRDLKRRGVKVIKVERHKPVFAKDKFAYQVYTDVYVFDPVVK